MNSIKEAADNLMAVAIALKAVSKVEPEELDKIKAAYALSDVLNDQYSTDYARNKMIDALLEQVYSEVPDKFDEYLETLQDGGRVLGLVRTLIEREFV
jgi:hypothetical protein